MTMFLDLLDGLESLLGTDEHFLLGSWLENAKSMATNEAERHLYEFNARIQLTLWGPQGQVKKQLSTVVNIVTNENVLISFCVISLFMLACLIMVTLKFKVNVSLAPDSYICLLPCTINQGNEYIQILIKIE